MCHVDDVEEEMRDEWDKRFSSSALMGWKRAKLLNIAQYVTILLNITENLHTDITVQDEIQLFQSVDIEHRQDVSIGRNHHFIPGPKEPFTIHLGFGVTIIRSSILCKWVRGLHQ